MIGGDPCASRAPWQQRLGAQHSLWLLCLLQTNTHTQNDLKIYIQWPITNKHIVRAPSHTCPHMQQPVDLPCNRLASSLVNRTLASLLWQYACLVSNFFFSQFKSSKSIFPTMWASEARLITLLGADSFNFCSSRFVNKKWPGGRKRQVAME